ncbi:MAG: HlyC/CorC family transporter [Lachnospiraceae bacterium]|nr:HlyC/CorC family transporter [Lachnospiraceae bacterium]
MDETKYPYLIMGLGAIIIVLLIALIGIFLEFRKIIWKRMKSAMKGGSFSDEDVTEEEIISMVKEGHEQGVLLASEAEMIHNIFEFSDKEAKDIMTHRKSIIAIDGTMSYYDVVSFILETGKSRFPVYLEDIDNMIGVLHIKDAFAYCQKNEIFRTPIKDIPKLIREVEFIPETININTLFKKMQMDKSHLWIVIDEYGQTSGIVAMEDILEEIVGNIEDEHDEEEEIVSIQSDGSYTIDGLTELRDVLEIIPLPIEEDAFETLNGLLISILEKIPNDGETETNSALGYQFEILEVEDRIIRKVHITKEKERK